jgi:hypothetical protein
MKTEAAHAHALREIGRGHVWGQFLYEVVLRGKVVAKICATPEHARLMASALDQQEVEA